MSPQKQPLILLDWGDTVMKVLPQFDGPMDLWPEVEAVPGIREALQKLHGEYILALATNAADSNEEAIWRALERADLARFFDHVFCVANLGHRKPSPGFFQTIVERLDIDPAAAAMVGDDFDTDVQGALAAGLAAIWYNPGSQGDPARRLLSAIHDLTDLPSAVKAAFGASS